MPLLEDDVSIGTENFGRAPARTTGLGAGECRGTHQFFTQGAQRFRMLSVPEQLAAVSECLRRIVAAPDPRQDPVRADEFTGTLDQDLQRTATEMDWPLALMQHPLQRAELKGTEHQHLLA
jgi:hypothetical protein